MTREERQQGRRRPRLRVSYSPRGNLTLATPPPWVRAQEIAPVLFFLHFGQGGLPRVMTSICLTTKWHRNRPRPMDTQPDSQPMTYGASGSGRTRCSSLGRGLSKVTNQASGRRLVGGRSSAQTPGGRPRGLRTLEGCQRSAPPLGAVGDFGRRPAGIVSTRQVAQPPEGGERDRSATRSPSVRFLAWRR